MRSASGTSNFQHSLPRFTTVSFFELTLSGNRQKASRFWLRSQGWDLTFITFSAVLVFIPYFTYFAAQSVGLDAERARNGINFLVAFCIGGPHMYATFTRTALEPRFVAAHRTVIPAAVIIPALVIYLGIFHFVILLTAFFFWASIHVLDQIVFIVDCYNGKQEEYLMRYSSAQRNWKTRIVDYAAVITALYPMAMYRFVHGTFSVGENKLYFPEFLQVDLVWILASVIFAASLSAFLTKTILEFRRGEGNLPKTLLILVTIGVTFFTPFFAELDVAFQGLNTWHSFQYLGLTWYINRLRLERGEISRPAMQGISGDNWWKFYGFSLMLNSSALVIWAGLLLTRSRTGLSFDQTYYIVVLCFLLSHYYHDHILFRHPEELTIGRLAR